MAIFATEGQFSRFSSLVKWMDTPEKPELFKDLVQITDAAGATFALGTVLGKVAATGKFVVSKQNAADGSQSPVAIYIGDAFGATADTVVGAGATVNALALTRGKLIVAREALKLDATFNDAAKKAAAEASLKAVGILVEASN